MYTYIALKSISGVTDKAINTILEHRNTLKGVFDESSEYFDSIGISSKIYKKIINHEFNEQAVEKEISLAKNNDIHIITAEDERYPKLLKEIHSYPALLYIKGSCECLNNICVAIIGSRKATKNAELFTYKLSSDLASIGITIVSGYAFGIDIAAHKGAVLHGATACVLGSGLLNIYPKQHIKYIDDIINKGGCFISEFALNEFPSPTNFPRRNRIISGLSKAIAVIEAGFKSGSLITVRYAIEQNRDIFAVPVFPSNSNNATNKLIKDGAKLLESSLDIIHELKSDLENELLKEENKNEKNIEFSNELEKDIYNTIKLEPMGLNNLCEKLNITIAEAMTTVSALELAGLILKEWDGKLIINNI